MIRKSGSRFSGRIMLAPIGLGAKRRPRVVRIDDGMRVRCVRNPWSPHVDMEPFLARRGSLVRVGRCRRRARQYHPARGQGGGGERSARRRLRRYPAGLHVGSAAGHSARDRAGARRRERQAQVRSRRPTTNNASRPRCRFTSPSIAPREISAVPMNSCWKSVSRAVSSSSASASMSPARRAAARTSRARRANQCGFASAAPPRMPSLHRLNAQGDEPGTARQDRRAYRIRTKIEKLARARYAGFMRR